MNHVGCWHRNKDADTNPLGCVAGSALRCVESSIDDLPRGCMFSWQTGQDTGTRASKISMARYWRRQGSQLRCAHHASRTMPLAANIVRHNGHSRTSPWNKRYVIITTSNAITMPISAAEHTHMWALVCYTLDTVEIKAGGVPEKKLLAPTYYSRTKYVQRNL